MKKMLNWASLEFPVPYKGRKKKTKNVMWRRYSVTGLPLLKSCNIKT